jgi:single-stranded-DNA-specific exonuclease
MTTAIATANPPHSSLPPSWLSGKRWHLAAVDERLVAAMQQQLGYPEILCRLLVHRGTGLETAEEYLAPSLRNALPDPLLLKDMDKAATRLADAILADETIGVFGDYDVDGATSSAIILLYCRWLGRNAVVHIPDRQKEGYGPNLYGLNRLRALGASLIITVDTGTLAHAVLAEFEGAADTILVIDHHQGEPELPAAFAVVNPNRFDEDSSEKHLAAVGVTFLLLVATHQKLRAAGFFSGKQEPDLRWLLDCVALGTVCDVVPLRGANRAFVVQGLKILRQRQNCGLTALMDVAGLDEAPNVYHLGFLLGPRINAGGRVGESDLGVRLLTATSREEAMPLAKQLDHFNKERKAIEVQVQEQALLQAQSQSNSPIIFASGTGWHEGVIGIVAGRLKEQFNRPAAVIAWNDEGKGKASARSVAGVDLGRVVIAARQRGLLVAGGGHSMAAGFTVMAEQWEAFQQFVTEAITADVTAYHLDYTSEIEGELPCSAVTSELAVLLEQAGPYGAGNVTPRFLLPRVKIVSADVIGQNHLRCFVVDADFGGRGQPQRVKVMGFGITDTPLGQELLNHHGRVWQLIGKLKREFWQGRESVTFMLEDARAA